MKHMPFKPIFLLAWRNLWRNHRRTLIMLAAITVGVWAMMFMTSVVRKRSTPTARGIARASGVCVDQPGACTGGYIQ